MHRIVFNRGRWGYFVNTQLIHENCPNPDCKDNKNKNKDGAYFYDDKFHTPSCNKCGQELYGQRFKNKPQARINYFLEFLNPGVSSAK
jgi:hypothetical protein